MSSKNKLKSTLLFAGATTLAIHLFNKYIAQSALLNQIFKKENNTYYDSVFGKIYYKKEGSGSPVLLIHDFNLGSSSYEWRKYRMLYLKHILSTPSTCSDVDDQINLK